MAHENLDFFRKLLNNPGKVQSSAPVIERRILIHHILQDRNPLGQLDWNKVLVVGKVFRIISVDQRRLSYSLAIDNGMSKIDMIEGLSAFYWDEVMEQNAQAITQLWDGLEQLSLATGLKFYKPTDDDPAEKQRTAILTELTRVTQYYLWGTLHHHDASLVPVMYREDLEQGWPHSPVQNLRIREEAPKISSAIHHGEFAPEFVRHVIKSSRPE